MAVSTSKSKKEAAKRMKEEKKRLQQEKKMKQQQAKPVKASSAKKSSKGAPAERPIIGRNISGPTNFSHDTHVGWDSEKGFEVRNIPPEWRKLFQQAGVKKSEIEDPQTRKLIMNTVKASMMLKGSPLGEGEFPDLSSQPSSSSAPPPPSGGPPPPVAGGPPPPSAGPPPPSAGPPPPSIGGPPVSRGPAVKKPFANGTVCTAKWSGDGQFYPAKIESSRTEGSEVIYTVLFTEYGNTEDVAEADVQVEGGSQSGGDSGGSSAGGGLFAELATGMNRLRKVEETTPQPPPADTKDDIVNSIQKALAQRRAGMVSVYDAGAAAKADDEDDEWGDDDDWGY